MLIKSWIKNFTHTNLDACLFTWLPLIVLARVYLLEIVWTLLRFYRNKFICKRRSSVRIVFFINFGGTFLHFIDRVRRLRINIKGITRMITLNCFHSWLNTVSDLGGTSKEFFTRLGQENQYFFIYELMMP